MRAIARSGGAPAPGAHRQRENVWSRLSEISLTAHGYGKYGKLIAQILKRST